MSRKQLILLALAVVLIGIAAYRFYNDLFPTPGIQIYHRSGDRPMFSRRGSGRGEKSAVNPISFGFNRKVSLTSVKVFLTSELETNKYPHAIWDMISESNSIPLKGFFYGQYIPGLHPKVKGAQPDLLQPGVKYRLIIEADSMKGEHDFVPVPRTP